MEKKNSTEDRIKEAARKVFIKKGLAAARMQEIADEARINKAMLHYYYRSKDQLFKKIFDEVSSELAPKILSILGEDRPLESKVRDFVSHYLDLISVNPFIPLFLLNELKNRPEGIIEKVGIQRSEFLKRLGHQLQEEARAGKIKPISPAHFMINLISLSVFPFLGQPVLQVVFGMGEAEFAQFIEERKKLVPEFIMSSLKP